MVWEKSDIKHLKYRYYAIFREATLLDMYEQLYKNHAELSQQFLLKHKGSENLSLEESFNMVASIIMTENRTLDSTVIETLLEVAAFLSEKFIETYGGQWDWDEKLNICTIQTSHSLHGKRTYGFLRIILQD